MWVCEGESICLHVAGLFILLLFASWFALTKIKNREITRVLCVLAHALKLSQDAKPNVGGFHRT